MAAPAFVYVAPARHEDILKIGFSHDPCDRVRAFHERWFDYFDLERGFVLAAVDEKDARRIERLLAQRLKDHRSRAPLVIERAAGGYTEWYRGAHAAVHALAVELVGAGGYAPLQSLEDCLRERLLQERDALYERSIVLLDAIEALAGEPRAAALARSLHNVLDGYTAMQIETAEFLPTHVLTWLEQAPR
jgi:hypothetical protein